MRNLGKLISKIIDIIKFVFKYRLYFMIFAFIIASEQYSAKLRKGKAKNRTNPEAMFINFYKNDNSFDMIVSGSKIRIALSNVIIPLPTKDKTDCATILSYKAQNYIYDKISTEQDITVKIFENRSGIYYSEIFIKGVPLSKTLSLLSYAYPKNLYKSNNESIDWCVLLSQYERV